MCDYQKCFKTEEHKLPKGTMSFDLSKNDYSFLNDYLKFTILESVGFNDRLRNGNCINSRWLFHEFSFDQRSYLRNFYIKRGIKVFYVENHVGDFA